MLLYVLIVDYFQNSEFKTRPSDVDCTFDTRSSDVSSDLYISFTGDPIWDLIPIHLDVFRGDAGLLKSFLESYKLPLVRRGSQNGLELDNKYGRLSYHAM